MAALDPDRRRAIVVITDGSLPEQSAAAPRTLSAELDWQQVGDEAPNRAIVAFAARPWGGNLQVYARAANYAQAPAETTIRLYGDDQLVHVWWKGNLWFCAAGAFRAPKAMPWDEMMSATVKPKAPTRVG